MLSAHAWRRVAALLVAAVLASCNPDLPTTPPSPALTPSAGLLDGTLGTLDETTRKITGTLLRCEPLPYASNSRIIGPAGGEIRVGPHTLRIPAGALDRYVRIFAEAPSDSVRSVRLYPEGLRFDRPAALTLSYRGCGLITGLLPRVAYTSESLVILAYLPSWNNLFAQTVTGRLEHFSRYATAW